MLEEWLTTPRPQYVMWQELKRGLKRGYESGQRKPSMENDARKARIIRGLQKLAALAEGCRRESWEQRIVQAEVQAAAVKAQKLTVIAQIQVT